MFNESDIVPECITTPGSFGALMALYECNFIKLSQLVGDPALTGDVYISASARDFSLHMSIDESTRYTRIIRLTYLFDDVDGRGYVSEPDLAIKTYLDARMTEVLGWRVEHRHEFLAGLVERFATELDRRWSCNMMLGKWLDYLLEMDHRFVPAAADQAVTA